MKFSSSLKFNAVSDWWDEYISYDLLKKYVYQLEKQQHADVSFSRDLEASTTDLLQTGETSALLGEGHRPTSNTTDILFAPLLNKELKKVVSFYEAQEKELLDELSALEEQIERQEELGLEAGLHYFYDDEDEDEDEDDEDEINDQDSINKYGAPQSISRSPEGTLPRRRRALSTGATPGFGGTRKRKQSSASRRPRIPPVSTFEGELPAPAPAPVPGIVPTPEPAVSSIPIPRRHRTSVSSYDTISESSETAAGQPSRSLTLAGLDRPRAQSTISRLANKLAGNLRDSIASLPGGGGGAPDTNIWTSKTDYAYDTRLLFKRKITNLFIAFTSLKSYVEVNYSGFRKILKKYDKVTYSELKDRYMHKAVEPSYPFQSSTRDRLNTAINRLISLYAKCVTQSNLSQAKQQLRLYQRENIAWERDTVWRQMIASQRRGEAHMEGESTGGLVGPGALLKEPGPALFWVAVPCSSWLPWATTPSEAGMVPSVGAAGEVGLDVDEKAYGGARAWRIRVTRKMIWKIVAASLFFVLLNVQVVKSPEANRCLAILVLCTLLWATEAIPLFITSTFVPLLLILLQVICDDDGNRLSTPDATKYVFSIMFSPTIMLLIGGFTISSALSKTNIDRVLITKVLSFAGTKPSTVLLAFMGVSCFASMWISNVAAPMLCFTLIKPILRNLPPKASFAPCLILGIALAANVGGQSSPISSPQNLIAMHDMDPKIDWGTWFIVALPVSFFTIILIWIMLLASYSPSRMPDGERLEIKPIRASREKFTGKQWWVSFVCIVTIVLWCVEKAIEKVVGDMGVIAIIPIVAFFSTGVLKKDDFEQFMWTIVFLAMGGIALGKGVVASGLLNVLDGFIREAVSNYSLTHVIFILSPFVLIISTFISHTIASVLLVPIAKEVGESLGGNHSNLLIFITALICSTGMGMPVSGFPNQTAATQEDELGEPYLTNVDFLKNGVPASVIATLIVATVGYAIMLAIGM